MEWKFVKFGKFPNGNYKSHEKELQRLVKNRLTSTLVKYLARWSQSLKSHVRHERGSCKNEAEHIGGFKPSDSCEEHESGLVPSSDSPRWFKARDCLVQKIVRKEEERERERNLAENQ